MSFRASHLVPAPIEQVWRWHEAQGAAARLTPSFMPMYPVHQTDSLARGVTTFALPAGLKWEAQHDLSGYIQGRSFTDVCTTAPIRALANWRHNHIFEPVQTEAGNYTIVTDDLHTRVPAAALEATFAYRQHQLVADITRQNQWAHLLKNPPVVAVTGSNGLVGKALCAQLRTLGITVVPLVRSHPKPGERKWDPERPHPSLLDGVNVLVHLAGEPIFGRFHEAHKQAIWDSRVEPTRKLAELVKQSSTCHALVSASAIGYYGHDRGDEVLNESSAPGEGFLADVVQAWEEASSKASERSTWSNEPQGEAFDEAPSADAKRVVQVRTGVVLSGRGGLLPVFKALFSVGLGGSFANRSPWLSWISIDDLTDIYVTAILDQTMHGVINAVAPNPVTNGDFSTAIGQVMNRPSFIPIPSIGPRLILGAQGADELAFADQRVAPQALEQAGFVFRHNHINEVLAHELGGEELLEDPTK